MSLFLGIAAGAAIAAPSPSSGVPDIVPAIPDPLSGKEEQVTKLPNGLSVLILKDTRFPLVSTLSLIHISEPTRLALISYAVFCLKKKNN